MTNREKVEEYLEAKGHTKNGSVSLRIFEMLDAGLLTYPEEKSPEFSLDWPHGWATRDGYDAVLLTKDFVVEGVPHLLWCIKVSAKGYKSDVNLATYQDGSSFRKNGPVVINKPAPETVIEGYAFPTAFGWAFDSSKPIRSRDDVLPATLNIHGDAKDA